MMSEFPKMISDSRMRLSLLPLLATILVKESKEAGKGEEFYKLKFAIEGYIEEVNNAQKDFLKLLEELK